LGTRNDSSKCESRESKDWRGNKWASERAIGKNVDWYPKVKKSKRWGLSSWSKVISL
jgi:hypothetical protein